MNLPGTSENDKKTATSNNITIYAIDSYLNNIPNGNPINSVSKNGSTRYIGTTSTNNNIGLDALTEYVKK